MSTLSATSSAGSPWPDARSARLSARQDKMFATVDADGSLGKNELKAGMKSLMPAPKPTIELARSRLSHVAPLR
ncbi:MAG: hypothetical protein H7306_02785 [Bacteriovorax sp.]|nr:hypothetical protein [Rhizobacter sp.]